MNFNKWNGFHVFAIDGTSLRIPDTVETLKEMGKLNSAAGTAILGAAIIDDIMGIIALTIITSLADTSVSIGMVLLKIVAFFVCAGIAGFVFYKFFKYWTERYKRDMTPQIILFTVVLVVVAMLTKVIGCGLGGKLCGYTNRESIQIGTGMVSRGEVALIVASKGASAGLMSSNLLGPIIIVVVVTTVISPILLKLAYKAPKAAKKA